MSTLVVKVVKTDAEAVAARTELAENGFSIKFESSVDTTFVDATKQGGGDEEYGAGYTIVGSK